MQLTFMNQNITNVHLTSLLKLESKKFLITKKKTYTILTKI